MGNDLLYGAGGLDKLIGGSGDDTYEVDAAGVALVEATGAGADTVKTTLISYTLGANVENLVYVQADWVTPGTGDFTGLGNTLANQITGGSGNDTLSGGSGADTMAGGFGDDSYVVDNASDGVTESAGAGIDSVATSLAAYMLSANVENLVYSGAKNFAGTGNGLANQITGGIGKDTLDGGLDADTLTGGLGNDTYIVDDAADLVVENPGEGNDTIKTALGSLSLAGTNVENLTFTGVSGDFTGTGNGDANTITGGTGNDVLDGGTGVDKLIGGAGDDTYRVDNALDVVTEAAAAGTDTVLASVNYTLAVNIENLTFIGLGDFAGTGNTGANTIIGGVGNDTLDGKSGADTMTGGDGNDTYVVDNLGDSINDTSGTDTVQTTLAAYTLAANMENLTYIGASKINATGNGGDNTITGGTGNDTLSGGAGADDLHGGLGADRFVFKPGEIDPAGGDRISDFTHAEADKIDVSLIDAKDNGPGDVTNDAFTFIASGVFTHVKGQLHYAINGSGGVNVEGDLNGDGTADFIIQVDGVTSLVNADFIL